VNQIFIELKRKTNIMSLESLFKGKSVLVTGAGKGKWNQYFKKIASASIGTYYVCEKIRNQG
jgi:FlaA1/EpsC-like NDP-sugar epimerase